MSTKRSRSRSVTRRSASPARRRSLSREPSMPRLEHEHKRHSPSPAHKGPHSKKGKGVKSAKSARDGKKRHKHHSRGFTNLLPGNDAFGELRYSSKAKMALSGVIKSFVEKIVRDGDDLLKSSKTKTMTDRTIMFAAASTFTTKDLVNKGVNAVSRFTNSFSGTKKEKKAATYRAGLNWVRVGRIRTWMRNYSTVKRIPMRAAVCLAGILEHFMDEVIMTAGKMSREDGKVLIKTRYVKRAMEQVGHKELVNPNMFHAIFREGGVHQHIQVALLPKKQQKEHGVESTKKKHHKRKSTAKKTSTKKKRKTTTKKTKALV